MWFGGSWEPARGFNKAGNALPLDKLCLMLVFFAAGLPAQSAPPQLQVPLTVAKGVPLRVRLKTRVPIKHVGVPVDGILAAPVYVYDRPVIPAGSEVLGRVIKVQSAPRLVRARAIMNGSFTPLRTAQVEFDTLVIEDGRRIPISTRVMAGAAPSIQLVSAGNQKSAGRATGLLAGEWHEISAEKNEVVGALRAPGKIQRMKHAAKKLIAAEIPYHRQAFQPGTIFTAELQAPLQFGMATLPATELSKVGSPLPPDSILHARLVTPLNSATARQGGPVEAIVTQPFFSAKHQLIVPQGSQLEGTVMRAKAARRLRRNGNLRFTFQRLVPPDVHAPPETIQASVQRMEVARSSHLKLDAEGGVAPAPSKKKYVAPALSLLLAVQAATPDRDAVSGDVAGAVPGQGGVTGKVLAGGWGFGLVGSALSLAVKSRAFTAALGFYGAAWSVYSNLLTRGRDVVFPANTPMEIRLGSHERPGLKMPLPSPPQA
ncbi:MAG TPA: hypothetical protein VGX94_12775 [Terriglobia bacterium]|nr:hypothetical protein [Terriglobia bacterium]